MIGFRLITLLRRKYRAEVIIAAVSLFLSILASVISKFIFDYNDPYLVLFLGAVLICILLMCGILFNQKRLLENKFKDVSQILKDQFCYAREGNQFFRRRSHFAPEKTRLAKTLVVEALDNIIGQIVEKTDSLKRIVIIIDSGTTLTPVFKELLTYGLTKKKSINIDIFTNSMSGIDEIHKLGDNPDHLLGEENFNIIGGQPLNKYRATTGDYSQKFLKTLKDEKNNSSGNTVFLSILTANWFLMGNGLKDISICARGRGHLDFKIEVCTMSDYVVLVSPLGKLLRLNEVKELNKLLSSYEDDEYDSFSIEENRKNRTFLLTTLRSPDSRSPFVNISVELKNIRADNTARNYILTEQSKDFQPPGETRDDIFLYETPHRYIRDNVKKAFGFTRP